MELLHAVVHHHLRVNHLHHASNPNRGPHLQPPPPAQNRNHHRPYCRVSSSPLPSPPSKPRAAVARFPSFSPLSDWRTWTIVAFRFNAAAHTHRTAPLLSSFPCATFLRPSLFPLSEPPPRTNPPPPPTHEPQPPCSISLPLFSRLPSNSKNRASPLFLSLATQRYRSLPLQSLSITAGAATLAGRFHPSFPFPSSALILLPSTTIVLAAILSPETHQQTEEPMIATILSTPLDLSTEDGATSQVWGGCSSSASIFWVKNSISEHF
nr:pollen-specific leucine-rich repeat extensin-like protein 2 [Arachis hypogaea]